MDDFLKDASPVLAFDYRDENDALLDDGEDLGDLLV